MKISIAVLILGLIGCADKEVRVVTLKDIDTSCKIEGDVITCPDGSAGNLQTGSTIYSIIYPCGDESNNQEILFRLSTGQVIAVFDSDTSSNLQQTRLTVLRPGSYVTTDQSNNNNRCRFTVLENNEGVLVVEPGKEEVL